MIETEMQQLLIDAAVHAGGKGLKLNNRFLVGVVDLLISIPGHRPMWLEAKRLDLSAKTIAANDHTWDLAVTKKQRDHLRDWKSAGMLTGVASFVQETGKGIKGLRLALYTYDYCAASHNQWHAYMGDHYPIGDHNSRMQTLADALMEFSQHG